MSVHRFSITEPAPTGLGSHRFQVVQGAGVPVNITVEGGGGGGAVDSVNGQTGVVVLDAADVGAATAAQGALADTAVQPGALATVATTGAYADLSGTPTLGTAAAAATTDFATAAQGVKADTAVQPAALTAAVAAVVDTAPAALDTLNELAAALGDDANFAATVTTALAGKQPLDADLTALAAAGNSATLAATTAAFTTADETKLDGIATGATANATDAQLRDRTTHTGAQAISTVTGLQAALDAKAPLARTIGTQAGATYTLAASDCYTYLRLTNASPDLTVPDDADVTWPVGGWVEIFASGGAITFVEDTSVTINVAAGQSLIGEDAGSGFTLIKVAANTWDLVGRLAA